MTESINSETFRSGVLNVSLIDKIEIVIYNNINNVVINDINKGVCTMLYDANDLLVLAQKETQKLDVDEVFLVKDLFKGYFWNRRPIKVRLLLGTLFLNFVNKTGDSIVTIGKTSSNQQKYKKVRLDLTGAELSGEECRSVE